MKKILILTPDGVGSTLLQRSMCAWGNLYDTFVNPHELTNGLKFKDGLILKDWSLGYSQSLSEIIEVLNQNQTNLIVRLAHYHIIARNDPIEEQIKFYQYLNNNFQIISCHRRNILEYAMSWAIRDLKKTLNVYSFTEKFLIHPSTDRFLLDTTYINSKLTDYTNYEFWLHDNFQTASKFYYEDIAHLDKFISDILERPLDEMLDHFGISMAQYCLLTNSTNFNEIDAKHGLQLVKLISYLQQLTKKELMPNGMPLKMNSFNSKVKKTDNFRDVLKTYNLWAITNNQYQKLSMLDVEELIKQDMFYHV